MDVAKILDTADPLARDERLIAGVASAVISSEERRQDPAVNTLTQGWWFGRCMDKTSTLIHGQV